MNAARARRAVSNLTDYKTAGSRSAPEPDQLILYRKAVQQFEYQGKDEVAARFVMLLKTAQPDITVVEPEIGPADFNRLHGLYRAVWEDIQRGCSYPTPGWQCKDCQWRAHCDQA